MANGRHREEPVRRPLRSRLPGLPRPLPLSGLSRVARLPRSLPLPRPQLLIAAGVVVVMLGVSLGVALWPDTAPDRAGKPAALTDEQRYAALAADALTDAAALRAQQRAARDRTRVTPVAPPTTTKPTPPPALKVVAKLWATSAVNVRSEPSSSADKLGTLDALSQIGVTGVTKSGWSQVVLSGGRGGWVKSSYLSKTKPKPSETSSPSGVSGKPCSISSSIERSLTANARAVYRAVCAQFGNTVSSFGGYRAGDSGDHGSGRAVDIMVSGDPGTQIARYVQAHARELNVTYVIYQQHIWLAGHPTSDWDLMEDRGSTTANHYDHVHVSVE